MEVTWPSSDPASGGKKTWMLTHQVLFLLECNPTDETSMHISLSILRPIKNSVPPYLILPDVSCSLQHPHCSAEAC